MLKETAERAASLVRRSAEVDLTSRRERNKQDKLQRILGAARALFHAKRFADVTTQEIAHAAHIGAGTLFLYVTSKEDLLVLVFKDEMINVARRTFAKIDARKPIVEQLLECFNAMMAYHGRDLALARVLLKEVAILSNPVRRADVVALMRVLYGGIADLLKGAQDRGALVKTLDVRVAAETLFAAYYLGLIMWVGGTQTKAQCEVRLRRQIDLVLGNVSVAAPARGRQSAAGSRARVQHALRAKDAIAAPKPRRRANPRRSS